MSTTFAGMTDSRTFYEPIVFGGKNILRQGSGLTYNIIKTLVLILFLAMVLTVFVMDIFWQRDLVRSFADHAETMVLLVLQEEGLPDIPAGSNDRDRGDLFLQKTGALGGGLLAAGEKLQYFGQTAGYDSELQQAVKKAIASKERSRTLQGFSINVLVPAKKYLILAQPFIQKKDGGGALVLLYSLEPVYASMRQSQRMVFVYLLVNLIILTVIGLFRFFRFTVRPIEELVRLTDAYEEEGAVPFLALEKESELGQLSTALNQMLQRIEEDRTKLQQSVASLEAANNELVATREEMVRAEKLASVGRLAAGLAHEIGNPIRVVQGYLGLLQQEDLTSAERNDFARRSESELQRINKLVRQLLDFSRVNSGRQEEVSIHSVLQDLVEMVSCQPFMDGVEIQTDFAAAFDVVLGTTDQLQQVFLNCLLNAADALASSREGNNRIEIRTMLNTEESDFGTKEYILLSIKDTGAGIAREDLANIFDPFFTTKEPGKGTGLGLSVAYSIVEGCGGTMRVESTPGQGTTMFIELPLLEMPD